MKKVLGLVLVLGLLFYSCAPAVHVTPFETVSPRPATEKIDIYTSVSNVKKPYKEIAMIEVDNRGWSSQTDKMMPLLIEEAKSLGADGLILLSSNEELAGGYVVGSVVMASKQKVLKAVAIVYQ